MRSCGFKILVTNPRQSSVTLGISGFILDLPLGAIPTELTFMHLFTCSCGHDFPVSLAQAGQSVECPQCRESLMLPKLGALKLLPLAEDSPQTPPRSRWSLGRGIAFSVMFFGMVAALVAASVFSYQWLRIEKPPTVEKVIADGKEHIQNRNATELFDFWLEYGEPGLSTRKTMTVEYVRSVRDGWKHRAFGAYAGLLVCILGMTILIATGKRSRE